jgi:hypothetical protein
MLPTALRPVKWPNHPLPPPPRAPRLGNAGEAVRRPVATRAPPRSILAPVGIRSADADEPRLFPADSPSTSVSASPQSGRSPAASEIPGTYLAIGTSCMTLGRRRRETVPAA